MEEWITMLYQFLDGKRKSALLYGLTPPKKSSTKERILEISQTQLDRLKGTPIDGVILYDLQDEASRTKKERPFPFLETIDPLEYASEYLNRLNKPFIIYKAVGKCSNEEVKEWLQARDNGTNLSVFVGAASKMQTIKTSLPQAYSLYKNSSSKMRLGGVAIAERHVVKQDEDLRVIRKIEDGCSFFITQAVYDYEATKSFLMDYKKSISKSNLPTAPMIFTLTPCGSIKTLEFMEWLGIHIPKEVKNRLINSPKMLEESMNYLISLFKKITILAKELNIPIGVNIESVAIRKEEIEASIKLIYEIENILRDV
ncbi:MAG: methylenetetrahydrofolate reductase [Sulfurospirillaceae bacterium]